MPDPICHATQGSLILLSPFLAFVRRRITLTVIAIVGAVLGDLPDLIGVYGVAFKHDHGGLYTSAHTGAIKDVLQYIPMYWLHLKLDSQTHSMESRWSLWNNWVEYEVIVWTVNIALIILFYWIWRRVARKRSFKLAEDLHLH